MEITDKTMVVSRKGTSAYPESWFINEPVYPGGPLPTPYPRITVDESAARLTAEQFFQSIGDTAWVITSAERAGMIKSHYHVLNDDSTETQGYLISCMRRSGASHLFDYENSGGARLHFDRAEYAANLPLERMKLFVDESGIYALMWENPIEIKKILTESIDLLPFEQIQAHFVQAMKNGLSWAAEHPVQDGSLPPTRRGIVRRIILSYVFVQEKDAPDDYLMVPAWLFFYTTEAELQMSDDGYVTLPHIIALNAVDSSRIELG